jgi:hypothetical protein
MKKIFVFILLLIHCLLGTAQTRLIVMSDIGGSDPDDKESMIHLMVSLDQVNLEGIISQHAWIPYGVGAVNIINNIIDGYAKVFPNLKVHSDGFPSADYLHSIVKMGQSAAAMKGVGKGKDSDGSEWIIHVVDKDDPRPVWIAAWSGLSTLAQSLWKVEQTRSKEELAIFVSKICVYDVLGQDDAGAWIAKNFPNITYIRNTSIYGWAPSDDWTKMNIQNIGTLGALYPDRIWATEGDSPSFMYCLENGLNSPEHPDYGGWGGRFDTTKISDIRGMDWVKKAGLDESQYDPYYMIPSAKEGSQAISNWKNAIYNDFAARMKWTVNSDYAKANHHPHIVLNGDSTKNIIEMSVHAGGSLILNASKTFDPDGNNLMYKWIFYKEPSSYKGELQMNTSVKDVCKIAIPEDADGKSIHIILEVTDDGTPALTSYRRIVISPDNTSDISNIKVDEKTNKKYNIEGQLVSNDYNGVSIVNGRKALGKLK